MGYVSVFVVNHDALPVIRYDQRFGERIALAALTFSLKDGVGIYAVARGVGSYGNAAIKVCETRENEIALIEIADDTANVIRGEEYAAAVKAIERVRKKKQRKQKGKESIG